MTPPDAQFPGQDSRHAESATDTGIGSRLPAQEDFLLRRFETQAAGHPDAVAVKCGTTTLSYGELNARADRLAGGLIAAGVGRGSRVALLLPPSVGQLVATIGVLKAGAAYVPLDAGYPPERLRSIIDQAEPALLIFRRPGNTEFLPAERCRTVEDLLTSSPQAAACELGADDLSYLMFTSGSTGLPNGVMVSHGNIAGLFAALEPELVFSSADRWSVMHSPAFGFSVWETWGALSTGGQLVLVPEAQRGDPQRWSQTLVEQSVSVLSITPSAFRQWLWSAALPSREQLAALRLIVFSGEALQAEDLRRWFAHVGSDGPVLANTYALTETAGRVALKILRPEVPPVQGDIGRPTADAQVLLLEESSSVPVADGLPGELVIVGPMVALGYLHNPELTARRFVELELENGERQRGYRTGDRALRNADGSLTFIGRVDDQVKLRGHRIELTEIEARLRGHPDVADAAVVLQRCGEADQLTAWVVPAAVSESPVELWPSLGEYQVYDELLYDFMSADETRVASYQRAFEQLAYGKVVLDIGTGKDAILARLCAAAGARKVYAVEVLEDAAAAARELIQNLGLGDRIEVICGDMMSLELPEPVELCTQGIVGNIGSSDGIVPIWNAARRLFADGAVAVPSRCETLIAPAQLPDALREAPAFTPLAAMYAQQIFAAAGQPFDVRLCVRNFPADGLLAEGATFEDLDFATEMESVYQSETAFDIARDGLFDGFLLWTRITNGADEAVDFFAHQQAWLPVWFPMADTPVAVRAGDRIEVSWQCDTPVGQIFPDYSITAVVHREGEAGQRFSYCTRHFETAYQQTAMHRQVFAAADESQPFLNNLQNWLAGELPAHMVPARWESLDRLPLNANGKLDRRALSQLQPLGPGAAEEPLDDALEQAVATVWCDVLGRASIGREEDFFTAGGDSILAVRLTTEVQRLLDTTVFLAALFDAPTVAGYAEWLRVHHAEATEQWLGAAATLSDTAPKTAGSGTEPGQMVSGAPLSAASTTPAPLSWPQQSLWFLNQLYPQNTGANEQFLIRVRGATDAEPDRLRASWQRVLARHDVLRSRFAEFDGVPLQEPVSLDECLANDATPLYDLRDQGAVEAAEQLRCDAARDIREYFDLSVAPLLRTRLYALPDREWVLLVTAHHIVADGLCVELVRDELALAYTDGLGGPDLPAQQYADFARRQHESIDTAAEQAELAWWQNTLDGHAGLPLVAGGSGAAAAHETRIPLVLDVPVADRLREIARASSATLFMTLLAAWRVWLQRCFDESDLLLGSPVTLRRDEATARMIGCLVNNVVFRNPLPAGADFLQVLAGEREAALAAYDHSAVAFEKVVEAVCPERQFGRHPLFQLLFMFEDRSSADAVAEGFTFSSDVLPVDRASYWDMELSITDRGAGQPLSGFIGVRDDLFDVEALRAWPACFATLLSALVEAPDKPVAQLPLLDSATAALMRVSRLPLPAEQTLHGLFALQAQHTPDAVAIIDHGADAALSLTYAGLQERADCFAGVLAAEGVGHGQRVGLAIERSADAVALLLAVLKCGAAWLPLDPAYPPGRLRQMLEDARPELVVVGAGAPDLNAAAIRSIPLADLRAAAQGAGPPAQVNVGGGDAAYVLFTSGSTGRPKGAESSHAGAVSRCVWMWQEYGFSAGDVFAQRTSLNFVDSLWEIFGPLLHGACCSILPSRLEHDPQGIYTWLVDNAVTHLVTVPVLLEHTLNAAAADGRGHSLRSVISSGEPLRAELAQRFVNEWPAVRLLNTYGTSETWDATCYEVPAAADAIPTQVPVGRPVANAGVYIVDRHLRILPPGVAGELCVGGLAVARGYVNDAELTRERFVELAGISEPHRGEDSSVRVYRTGDRALRRADGTVVVLGRLDRQLKLRGLRIDPGDIESSAREFSGVVECALAIHEAGTEQAWFSLHVEPRDAEAFVAEELRAWLSARLPRAMVPAEIRAVSAWPLTPSGKIDRLALAQQGVVQRAAQVAPRDATEEQLAAIFCAALGAADISIHDDFFALRGNSLLATQVSARVCDQFGIELPLQCLFETPTVAGLALTVNALLWAQESASGQGSGTADREVLRL